MEKIKLNVLLAKTDHLTVSYKENIDDYIGFFKHHAGSFLGEKKTYEPKADMIDLPSERANKSVVSTVREKFEWFEKSNGEYIDSLFAQEATNAAGRAKAELVVEGKSWGEFSSLELLRLKGLIENGKLQEMYTVIPVRSDAEQWDKTKEEQYKDRDIYESPKISGVKKSVTKENYILSDPNITTAVTGGKSLPNYTPQIAVKDHIIEVGNYSYQKFSGELSHRERAEILRRRSALLNGVIVALKTANEAEAIESQLTSKRIFEYLHAGK